MMVLGIPWVETEAVKRTWSRKLPSRVQDPQIHHDATPRSQRRLRHFQDNGTGGTSTPTGGGTEAPAPTLPATIPGGSTVSALLSAIMGEAIAPACNPIPVLTLSSATAKDISDRSEDPSTPRKGSPLPPSTVATMSRATITSSSEGTPSLVANSPTDTIPPADPASTLGGSSDPLPSGEASGLPVTAFRRSLPYGGE